MENEDLLTHGSFLCVIRWTVLTHTASEFTERICVILSFGSLLISGLRKFGHDGTLEYESVSVSYSSDSES